jgi:hypothetical protein
MATLLKIPIPAAPTIAVRVATRYASLDAFIENCWRLIRDDRVFIFSSVPHAPGTPIRFLLTLSDGTPVLRGDGKVLRARTPATEPERPPGMEVQFRAPDEASRRVLALLTARREGRREEMTEPVDPPPEVARAVEEGTPRPRVEARPIQGGKIPELGAPEDTSVGKPELTAPPSDEPTTPRPKPVDRMPAPTEPELPSLKLSPPRPVPERGRIVPPVAPRPASPPRPPVAPSPASGAKAAPPAAAAKPTLPGPTTPRPSPAPGLAPAASDAAAPPALSVPAAAAPDAPPPAAGVAAAPQAIPAGIRAVSVKPPGLFDEELDHADTRPYAPSDEVKFAEQWPGAPAGDGSSADLPANPFAGMNPQALEFFVEWSFERSTEASDGRRDASFADVPMAWGQTGRTQVLSMPEVRRWIAIAAAGALAIGAAVGIGIGWRIHRRPVQTIVAPPPLPPPVAPQGEGHLSVTSRPPGAAVVVDGKPAGLAPQTLPLAAGDHSLLVIRERFEPAERTVTIADGVNQTVDVELQRLQGVLSILSVPPGAQVVVDGEPAGETPLELHRPAFARYKVTVTPPGCRTEVRTVKLAPGAQQLEIACRRPR